MLAYELLAHLRHLTLAGMEGRHMMWLGTEAQWLKVEDIICEYETARNQ